MRADIITIGDEILIGQVIDTNSAWLATELNKVGFSVRQITSITDTPEHITNAVEDSMKESDLVIVTGGLGPTNDDRTKQTLAKLFNTTIALHKPTLDTIKTFLDGRKMPLNSNNFGQALQPVGAVILENTEGTAPGILFERDNTIVVSMPGVPHEMKAITTNKVIPFIKNKFNTVPIINRTVLTQGIAEAVLAETLEEWEESIPDYISLAYLPKPGMVRLRLSARGDSSPYINAEIEMLIDKLYSIIPDAIFGQEDDSLQSVIGEILAKKGLAIATAESCTGGRIASFITQIPGASKYFKGTVVAYSNEIKENILKVKKSTIDNNGAVSEPVVREMIKGICDIMDTDIAIATSGIAGPDGGTPDKPVGTTWIAIGNKNIQIVRCFCFGSDREKNMIRATQTALNMLRIFLEKSDCNYR